MTDSCSILVVDDEPESLALLTGILAAEGYQVRSADSGKLALASVAAWLPQLVLLDIRMPGIDGFAVCRRLKSCEETRDIPLMFISAASEMEERVEGLALGAVDYITKPFRREELLARVRTHLELGRLRAQLEKQVSQRTIELHATIERLRESEERFRNMADTAPVMIWVTGPDKGFTFFNKTWLDFTGCPLDQELGDGWAEAVHPEDLKHCFASFCSSFDARQDFQIEFRLRRADGEYRWVLCSGVPRFEPGGVFAGYIGSDIDITDQQRAEATLRRNLDEIAHLNRVAAMGELTASIAHELNQPLAAILSNAQAANRFLDGESPDLAEVQKCLTDIVADDKRAGEVIKRLRSPLKKDEFQAAVVDLNEVVGDVIRLIRNDALLRGASVTFEPCPDLSPVLGDRIQVHQVVLNLIVNGLQATADRRSGDRWVLVRTAEAEGGGVLLTVRDSGKGIAESDLARVFEPLFTTKQEGLGVGLSISRSIVQAHGGRIWAENSAGSGAIFSCVWPVAQQTVATTAR